MRWSSFADRKVRRRARPARTATASPRTCSPRRSSRSGPQPSEGTRWQRERRATPPGRLHAASHPSPRARGQSSEVFEVVERLMTAVAVVNRLARCRPKLTLHFCIRGATIRARDSLPRATKRDEVVHFCAFDRHWWRYSRFAQLRLRAVGQPVSRPRRREHIPDFDVREPVSLEGLHYILLDHLHRRTAGIGRCDINLNRVPIDDYIAHDSKLDDIDNRQLRIFDRAEQVEEGLTCSRCFPGCTGYHAAPG